VRLVTLSYGTYLKIDELLSLQQPLSDEHDEVLFIIIHQVYELWFKEMLHEADELRRRLESNHHAEACGTLKRMLTILKTLVAQIDILETMTPVSFLTFRDRLAASSGFQSWQFRAFEFACGNKRRGVLQMHAEGSPARLELERRFKDRTIYDSFLRFLAANKYPIPADALKRDVEAPPGESAEVQKILVDIYHNDPPSRQVCELLVDFDEGLQEWRYRHVKMVERTIGTKPGTGGSAGAEYLRTTLSRALFPDLWAIRTAL
jgi:tryptophan 2,3-dioxygenase